MPVWSQGSAATSISNATRVALLTEPVTYTTIGELLRLGRSPVVQTVASAASVAPSADSDLVTITSQGQALTLANPSGTPAEGWGVVIRVKDDGTARAIAYGTQYRPIDIELPTSTVAGKTLYIAGIWNAVDSMLDILAVGQLA